MSAGGTVELKAPKGTERTTTGQVDAVAPDCRLVIVGTRDPDNPAYAIGVLSGRVADVRNWVTARPSHIYGERLSIDSRPHVNRITRHHGFVFYSVQSQAAVCPTKTVIRIISARTYIKSCHILILPLCN